MSVMFETLERLEGKRADVSAWSAVASSIHAQEVISAASEAPKPVESAPSIRKLSRFASSDTPHPAPAFDFPQLWATTRLAFRTGQRSVSNAVRRDRKLTRRDFQKTTAALLIRFPAAVCASLQTRDR